MKRLISLLLITAMLLCLVPTVIAAEDTGDYPYPVIRGESTTESLIKYGNVLMKAGEPYAYVRGKVVPMPAPFYDNGTVYFPLEDIAGFLSDRVEWNNREQTATWYFAHYDYRFKIGSTVCEKYETRQETTEYINLGGTVKKDSDGKIYIPLENICKASDLRYSVTKDGIILFGTKEARYELKDFKTEDIEYVKTLFGEGRDANKVDIAFYVDPINGKDSNNGSVEHPFRSIAVAKQEVKNYKNANGQTGDIYVYLRGGEYSIFEPIVFTPEDSGENGYEIIYSAYPGEEVTIDGGERITGWEKTEGNIYRAYLGKDVSMLFEGDYYNTIARHPNEGYYKAVAAPEGPQKNKFVFRAGEFPELSSTTGLRWYGWPGGPTGHYNWHTEDRPVSSFDYNTRTVNISSVAYVLGTGSRYYLKGVREFLDAPGEYWYSTEDGYVYYYPVADDINDARIINAKENIFSLQGNSLNELTENISFVGLNLRNTSGNMIACNNAANITVDSCRMRNSGGHAVAFSGIRKVGIHVENCDIQNIGGAGVSSGPQIQPDDQASKYHVIKNNKIKNIGLVDPSSDAVQLYGCGYSYVGHNHVSEGRNCGIMLKGGTNLFLDSNYSSSKFVAYYAGTEVDEAFSAYYNPSCYNTVEYNEVVHFMWDSQDGGGIYTFQCGEGNIIRNNLITDMEANFSVCVGLYTDEYSRDFQVYNNLVYDCQNDPNSGGNFGCPNQPWGLSGDGATYNNLFAENHRDGTLPSYVWYAGNSYDSAWEKNVSVNSGKHITSLKSNHEEWSGADIGHNVYFNDDMDNYLFGGGAFTERDMKTLKDYAFEQHSLVGVDPELMDKEHGDLRLRYTSPAFRTGFSDINASNIGLTQDFKLVSAGAPFKMTTDIVDYDTEGFVSLNSGEQATITATLRDEEGYIVKGKPVTFTSDNPSVATVDANGKVTAVSQGVARITVASEGFSMPIDVLVDDKIVSVHADLSIDPIRIGEHSTVRSWYRTLHGRYIPANVVTYSSSDSSVASVDSKGFVTGNGAGKADIIVSDGTHTASVGITVKESMFDVLDVEIEDSSINVGEVTSLKLSIKDEKGNIMAAEKENVTVTVDDESILKVEAKTLDHYEVIPLKAGNTSINVKVSLDGKVVEKSVTVYVLSSDDKIDDEWKLSNYGVNIDEAQTPTGGTFAAYESGYFEFTTDGYNFWNNQDQGSFAFKKIKLDPKNPVAEIKLKFVLTPSEVQIAETGETNKACFGVMVRANDSAGSPSIHHRWEATGTNLYANRDIQDLGCGYGKGDKFEETPPELRIIYDAGVVEMYVRADASGEWTLFKSMKFNITNDELLIGVAGYSQNYDAEGKPMKMSTLGNIEVNVGADVDKSDADYDIGNAMLNG